VIVDNVVVSAGVGGATLGSVHLWGLNNK